MNNQLSNNQDNTLKKSLYYRIIKEKSISQVANVVTNLNKENNQNEPSKNSIQQESDYIYSQELTPIQKNEKIINIIKLDDGKSVGNNFDQENQDNYMQSYQYENIEQEVNQDQSQKSSITNNANSSQSEIKEIQTQNTFNKCQEQFIQKNQNNQNNLSDEFISYQNNILNKLLQKQYQLGKYLTTGGQGNIFEGYKIETLGQLKEVIFKIYFDCDKPEMEEEIKIMKIFEKNINVIQLIDTIEIEDKVFVLVIEKCKYSLHDELIMIQSKEIEFTQMKLFQMITDLLDGLIQLRIYKILHLDIKPQNILISTSDNYLYTDFGISSFYNKNKTTKIKGYTKMYASQEQQNDDKSIDFLSDVFSLGKTLQRILQIYQSKQPLDLICLQFKEIINENMIQNSKVSRKKCLILHQMLFLVIQSSKNIQFIEYYNKKISNIVQLFPFDNNKDIPYFLKLKLHYNKIQLNLHKIKIENCENTTQQENQNLKNIKQDIAASLNNVGLCYKALGDSQNALQFQLESLKMYKQLFKGDHPDIASSLNNVGLCYGDIGDYQNALQFQLESLKMYKQLFKGDHPSTASSLNNVGVCYKALGDFQNALQFQLESLKMYKQLFKGDHPSIATSLNNVGMCYGDIGDYQNALQFQLESLKMYKQLFKGDHPSIATSLNNVGVCYKDLGDSQNALQFQLESLKMRKQLIKQKAKV